MSRRLIALGVLAVVAGGCGGSTPPPTRATSTTTAPARVATASTLRAPPARPHRRAAAKPPLDPGRLPQTPRLPSAHTPRFHSEMRALWTAIKTGRVRAGLRAFFPEAAYAQVKAIGDPNSDWAGRLIDDFALDVAAAHALLSGGGARARLVEVVVPGAHWVTPNVCLNRVGYWEVPNARLVYEEGGETRSFGIASMISWRGVWYVVHLGAVVRNAAVGLVDDPSAGAGTSTPSSTC